MELTIEIGGDGCFHIQSPPNADAGCFASPAKFPEIDLSVRQCRRLFRYMGLRLRETRWASQGSPDCDPAAAQVAVF